MNTTARSRGTLHRIIRSPLCWITCGLIVLYLGLVAIRPSGVFWSLDEGGKFIYVQNVIRKGDPTASLEYPGRSLDKDLRFVPLYFRVIQKGQVHSWWPVGFPLLTLPFYRLLGWIGLYILPAVSGGLCALFTGLLVQHIHPQRQWLAGAAAAITGLATPIAFYSTMFWEHTLAAACLIGGVWSVLQAQRTDQARWAILAGVLLSLGTFFRTEIAAMGMGIGVALLFARWLWALLLGASYLLASLPWLLLNRHLMGHVLGRYWVEGSSGLSMPLFLGFREEGIWFIPHTLFNSPKVTAFELTSIELLLGLLFTAMAVAIPFLGKRRWVSMISYGGLAAICGRVLLHPWGYRSVHGFVLIAPQVVFFAWLCPSRSFSALKALLVGICGVYGLFYAARSWPAAGGLQWGPRYTLALYPLLVAAAVSGLSSMHSSLRRSLRILLPASFLACTFIGLGYQVRGLHSASRTVDYYQKSEEAIKQIESEAIVTDCEWLAMVMPDLYWSGSIFSAREEQKLDKWISEAEEAGLESAHYVHMDACDSIPLHEVAAHRSFNPDGLTVTPLRINDLQRETGDQGKP